MPIDTEAGAVANSALSAIPFSSLIGSPLNACIEAQAQAAKTSWEFIQNVGLNVDKDSGEMSAINVSFSYNKNGELVVLNIPILTVVPIPFLSIDKVVIDFIANISASSSSMSSDSTSEDLSAGGKAKGKIGFGPFSLSLEAEANYSSKKDSKSSQDSQYSVEYTMNVHVEGGQSDMPAGLGVVLNILQGATNTAALGGEINYTSSVRSIDVMDNNKVSFDVTVMNQDGLLIPNSAVKFRLDPAELTTAGITLGTLAVNVGTETDGTTPTESEISVDTNEKGVAGILITINKVDQDEYEKYNGSLSVDVKAEADIESKAKTSTAILNFLTP